MGEIDNTGAEGAGNAELRVECTTLLFELRLAIEATIVGINCVVLELILHEFGYWVAIKFSSLNTHKAQERSTTDTVLERKLHCLTPEVTGFGPNDLGTRV